LRDAIEFLSLARQTLKTIGLETHQEVGSDEFHNSRVAFMRFFVDAGGRPIRLVNVICNREMLHPIAGNSR
jgi:hypothetical protein